MKEKKLLKSEQEYFDYCVSNDIGSIYNTYSSTYCYFDEDSSEKCNEFFSHILQREVLNITCKPKKYPCIFTWHCEEISNHKRYYGFFVYEDDFKEE